VVGPPLGGFITTAFSWRWIFYVNVPLGLAGMALVLAYIPNQKSPERSAFDFKGFALMAVALASLTYAIDAIGVRRVDFIAAGLLIVAAVTGTLALRHLRSVPNPVVRLQALQARTFFVGSISGGCISRAAISA